MKETVIEYFKNYFGDELNESISHEMLIEAALDLVELRNDVLEANVARAARAHGARTELTTALKDKETRKAILATREGQRLINRHERPIPKPEGAKEVNFFSPRVFVKTRKPSLTNKYSPTFTQPQRTELLARRAIEAGPEGQRKKVTDDKDLPSPDEFHASAEQGASRGASDMQARIDRLVQQGTRRKETKSAIGINSSYDPRLSETKSHDDDDTPHEFGLNRSISSGEKLAKNRRNVKQSNIASSEMDIEIDKLRGDILDLPKHTKTLPDTKKILQRIRDERGERARKHSLLSQRGKKGRESREARGQGRLF